ncbi:hypothetical protein C0995_007423 [Termitomyces sp. Mi166|nr:hypothetical protein C0995_007423 [Termitomyces sp. Mi166\
MFFTLVLIFVVIGAQATQFLDRNLAYRSPFANAPHLIALTHLQLSHNTKSLVKRFESAALTRRQTQDASPFKDEHYFTFYGGNFSNAQVVWSGGVNFTHNVASGDPFDTSVLLWTRAQAVSPTDSTALPDQSVPVCVSYKIYSNPELSGSPADSGSAFTSYDVDWTLKVEATGLEPDTKYWFQFADCTNPTSVSPIGATRTFAEPNTPADKVNGGKPMTFAVFSCSQFQAGWFNAYGVAAQNSSADVFIHLGDYIYETTGDGASIGRVALGRELATIKDYRQRLGQYRTDASLVANNGWKAGSSDSNDTEIGCSFSESGACFTDRKLAAIRAYHEWMPIRQVTADDKLRIWRNFQIGKLIDLTMLDTRNYDRDITDLGYNTVVDTLKDDEDRSIMGAEQEQWFYDTLSESKKRHAVWRIVGLLSTDNKSSSVSLSREDPDAWDGYRKNRGRVFDHLSNNGISNTIILAGDSHDNWVSDLARPNDTSYDELSGNGAFGVEFGGTAVTSPSSFGAGISPADADVLSRVFVAENAELQWSEGSFRGFFTITVAPETLNATFYGMSNISAHFYRLYTKVRKGSLTCFNVANANLDHLEIANFVVKAGENKLSRPVAGGSVTAGIIKAALNSSTTASVTSTSASASASVVTSAASTTVSASVASSG